MNNHRNLLARIIIISTSCISTPVYTKIIASSSDGKWHADTTGLCKIPSRRRPLSVVDTVVQPGFSHEITEVICDESEIAEALRIKIASVRVCVKAKDNNDVQVGCFWKQPGEVISLLSNDGTVLLTHSPSEKQRLYRKDNDTNDYEEYPLLSPQEKIVLKQNIEELKKRLGNLEQLYKKATSSQK